MNQGMETIYALSAIADRVAGRKPDTDNINYRFVARVMGVSHQRIRLIVLNGRTLDDAMIENAREWITDTQKLLDAI